MSDPPVNPGLLEKLLAMDLETLADALCAAPGGEPGGARRILAAEAETLETTIDDRPEPVWPIEPLVAKEDEVFTMVMKSRKLHSAQSVVFLATVDFNHLAVPIHLLPNDCMPDPVLKHWHWWRGTGSDRLGTEDACRSLAARLLRQHDRMEKAPERPRDLDVRFDVKSPKSTHTFMTRYGWRGLWAPLYMRPDLPPDVRSAMFARIFKECEIEGRREVKKYARKMVREYDKLKAKPKPHEYSRGPFQAVYLPLSHIEMWDALRRWMAHKRPNGCNRSQVVKNLLRDQFERMPPEAEWDEKPYTWNRKEIK